MKKLYKIIMFSITSLLLCVSGVVVFAYYANHDDGQVATGTMNITSDKVENVASFTDLINKGTVDKYNDYYKVSHYDDNSSSNKRVILKLTDNITLQSDIILSKDIHIDLNGKTLNLNDNVLTFRHGYYGCFELYNGTIERGTSGKIEVDLINAGFQTNNLTYKKNSTTETEANTITVINLNAKYTAYEAFNYIADALATDLDKRPAFMSYAEVTAAESLTAKMFISNKLCSYNISEVEEACTFVYADLILPTHYLSSDISITYTSSDTNIISNTGVLCGNKYGNVNFTAVISKEGWEDFSVTFLLHVINISDTTTKQNVGIALMKSYLSDYYVGESLVIKENTVLNNYYYAFNHAIELPATALNGNIVFTYSTTNLSNVANEVNSIIKSANSDAYVFGPSSTDYHLVVNSCGKSISLNMYSTYVGLEETIAYIIINSLYGSSIIYDKASNGKDLVTIDDIKNATSGSEYFELKDYITAYDVKSFSYSLSDDVATHYEINSNKLVLKTGAMPEEKESSVQMTMTFGSTTVTLPLNVEYLDSNGTTLASYITYYTIYNAMVPSELETYFKLPFATNGIAPYTCYDVCTYTTERVGTGDNAYTRVNPTLSKPSNLKISLYYDGAEKLVFTYAPTPESFTKQLDAYLTSANITLAEIAAKTGDNAAYYKFSVDAQNSLTDNANLAIIYNYKFDASAENWDRYENNSHELTDNNTTYFTLLGGLFYNANGRNAAGVTVDYAVKNSNFFIWIYNKFKPNGYEVIESASSDMIIPTDWLGQSVVITKDDTGLSNVTDFSGIKYLKNLTEADLSQGTLSDNILKGISELKNLNRLVLSGCSLTSVTTLSKLANAGTLKVLDISNNNIQYFEGITEITSLEKVYLYKNNESNGYYGSKGICNYQAFADLMRNGCSVYNDLSGTIPILYAESNNLDDYRRLKEIAYQDKLKNGLDITKLYQDFINAGTVVSSVSGNSRPGNNPFGLQTAGRLSWGYQGDTTKTYITSKVTVGESVTASTYYELVNGAYTLTTDTTFVANKTYYVVATQYNATYFYVKLTYSTGGYILTVKFYVDRF